MYLRGEKLADWKGDAREVCELRAFTDAFVARRKRRKGDLKRHAKKARGGEMPCRSLDLGVKVTARSSGTNAVRSFEEQDDRRSRIPTSQIQSLNTRRRLSLSTWSTMTMATLKGTTATPRSTTWRVSERFSSDFSRTSTA